MPQFRTATEADLGILLTWTQALMAHEVVADDLELELVDDVEQHIKTWLNELISSESTLLIIAEDDNGIGMGCILGLVELNTNPFTIHSTHGVVQMVWVDELYRKTGLASQLLQYMEATFKELNIKYMEITYTDGNKEAEGFWEKHGYRLTSHHARKYL